MHKCILQSFLHLIRLNYTKLDSFKMWLTSISSDLVVKKAWVTFLLVSIFYFYKIICQLAWISFRISFISVVLCTGFTTKITFPIQYQFWWNKKRIKITQPCFYLILASYKIRNRFFDSSDTFWYYIALLKYLYWRFILDINTLVDILH